MEIFAFSWSEFAKVFASATEGEALRAFLIF
jgi:hypothetical protein